MFICQSEYRFKRSKPQSKESVTLPHQCVDLSILVKQLMNGQALNVGLSLESSSDATLDSPDLRKLDPKHVTSKQIDALMPPPSSSDGSTNVPVSSEPPVQ